MIPHRKEPATFDRDGSFLPVSTLAHGGNILKLKFLAGSRLSEILSKGETALMANDVNANPDVLVVDRRSEDRRTSDRRKKDDPQQVNQERRKGDRRKVERRRQIDPTTCERDYSGDEIEFMKAMDIYKRQSGRQFPTWSEVLEVIRCLGYRKVAEPTEIFKG